MIHLTTPAQLPGIGQIPSDTSKRDSFTNLIECEAPVSYEKCLIDSTVVQSLDSKGFSKEEMWSMKLLHLFQMPEECSANDWHSLPHVDDTLDMLGVALWFKTLDFLVETKPQFFS